MAIFNDVVNLWKSDDLLSQAWKESYNMIRLSNEMFEKAVFFLRNGGERTQIKALKKRDREINNFQMDVRKKVITHFAVSNDINHLPNGLVLLNVVVDIERVGDYTKNILDLAMNHPKKIISENNLEYFSNYFIIPLGVAMLTYLIPKRIFWKKDLFLSVD